jgi:hypothetical protein
MSLLTICSDQQTSGHQMFVLPQCLARRSVCDANIDEIGHDVAKMIMFLPVSLMFATDTHSTSFQYILW